MYTPALTHPWLASFMTTHSDDSLLARARDLDDQALALIHDQHFPAVYRYVYIRLHDAHLAEDIASEVFLRLLDTLHNPSRTINNLRPWLLGTASHLIQDQLRRKYRRREETIHHMEDLPAADDTALLAEMNDQQRRAVEVLRFLKDDQQQVISLRILLGCSVEETARIMGRSSGAIKVLLFRALAAMRRLMEAS